MGENMLHDIKTKGYAEVYLPMGTYVGAVLTGIVNGCIYDFIVQEIVHKQGKPFAKITEYTEVGGGVNA